MSKINPPFTIRRGNWQAQAAALKQIRQQVFIEEQQVPVELEWDGLDQDAVHLLAEDAKQRPIGTARMLANGHIGRMSVLKSHRRQGVGSALLAKMIEIAQQQGIRQVVLDAQLHAIPFYERFGFEICSEIFMDAGIPHQSMQLSLTGRA